MFVGNCGSEVCPGCSHVLCDVGVDEVGYGSGSPCGSEGRPGCSRVLCNVEVHEAWVSVGMFPR